jgi:hypothetical protein
MGFRPQGNFAHYLSRQLTSRWRISLQKFVDAQLVEKLPVSMESEDLLQCLVIYIIDNIHFNIIILFTPGSQTVFLIFGFPNQNVSISHPVHAACPAHLILLELCTLIIIMNIHYQVLTIVSAICYFICFKFKYSQRRFLTSLSIFFRWSEGLSFTPILNNR